VFVRSGGVGVATGRAQIRCRPAFHHDHDHDDHSDGSHTRQAIDLVSARSSREEEA
jgi:hypothetical protein